jgi:hypothetical protein
MPRLPGPFSSRDLPGTELVEEGSRFTGGLMAGLFAGAVLAGFVALRRGRQGSQARDAGEDVEDLDVDGPGERAPERPPERGFDAPS